MPIDKLSEIPLKQFLVEEAERVGSTPRGGVYHRIADHDYKYQGVKFYRKNKRVVFVRDCRGVNCDECPPLIRMKFKCRGID